MVVVPPCLQRSYSGCWEGLGVTRWGAFTGACIPGVGVCPPPQKVTMRGRPLKEWLLPWYSTQVGHSEPHRSPVMSKGPLSLQRSYSGCWLARGSPGGGFSPALVFLVLVSAPHPGKGKRTAHSIWQRDGAALRAEQHCS